MNAHMLGMFLHARALLPLCRKRYLVKLCHLNGNELEICLFVRERKIVFVLKLKAVILGARLSNVVAA